MSWRIIRIPLTPSPPLSPLTSYLQVIPEAAASGHNADLNAAAATSPVCQEEAEMRAALQFLMRHMVKRAVMRSPIKRALGLADLERAQAMVYKLVVNGLLEEPSGGKARTGEGGGGGLYVKNGTSCVSCFSFRADELCCRVSELL